MQDEQTFLAFGCTHCPLQDESAIDWLLGEIENYQPDVLVHLGDGHEADSASRWPTEYDWPLSDEFRAHNDLLRKLREVAPKARRIFLPGNHDDNLLTINRIDRKLRDLCDYRDHEPELRHWEQPAEYVYSRERGVFRLGQVTFAHGYEAHVSADEFQSFTLGVPYGLYVGAHTHRPMEVTQAHRTKAIPLPYWYSNTGTVRDIDAVPYMQRKRRHAWGQGLVLGRVAFWRYDKTMMPTSPLWEAETRIYRMFEG